MKHVYILLASFLSLLSQLAHSETCRTISNPIRFMLELENVTTNDTAMFFEVDMNEDELPELFLSSSGLPNGNGYAFDLYVNAGGDYKLYEHNYLTLRCYKGCFDLAITHDPKAPIVVFYDETAWGYRLNSSNVLEKEKVFSAYSLNRDNEYSGEIFKSLLAATRLEHPLIETNITAAVNIWDERIVERKSSKMHSK